MPARLEARGRNSEAFCHNEEILGNRKQNRSADSTGARRTFVRPRVLWMAVCLATAAVAVSSFTVQAQGRRTVEGVAEVLYEDSPSGGRLLHFLNTGTERIPLNVGPHHGRLKSGSRIRLCLQT